MAKNDEKTLTPEEILAMQAETEAAKAEAKAAKEALAQANAEAGKNAEASDAAEEERVPYVLPRNILSNAKHHTVNLNGVNYQVQTGVTVMVPKGVAEILDNAMEQRQAANELQDELSVEE